MAPTYKTLDRMTWLVLVDQLGVSCGISGDLTGAKKVFEWAITIEPEYPLFYYNLACACAEMNDLDSAIKNLTMAYKFKGNMIVNCRTTRPISQIVRPGRCHSM